jgi:regulator of protease activity HflC (stomatin/prohibitin superfamily)
MKKSFLVVFFVAVLFGLSGCTGIDEGNVGLKMTWGKITEETPLRTGFHRLNIFTQNIEIWSVKNQELKETASVPSAEGLISTLDVSLIYKIEIDKVVDVKRNLGIDYRTTIIEPYFRETIRTVVSGYNVKALYSEEGRFKISEEMLKRLKNQLNEKGITIIDVLLRDVKLPEVFSTSISVKLKTEQEALQKEFELQKAKKDAEIAIARAQGVAESNKIIAGSITENYLRWCFIETLKDSKNQVVYIPTEAGLPILEANRNK